MEESDDEYIPSSDEEVPRHGRKAWEKASIRTNKKNLTKDFCKVCLSQSIS